jgi:hypothetical protein
VSQIGVTKSRWEPQETQSESRRKGEDSVEYCEPGKTHAESWTRGEPRKSHRGPQETQPESGSKKKDSGESCEPGETHAKSQTRGEP